MSFTRDEILTEIRRCAAENGGRPLGRVRFQERTGIREADWSGRYWVRWNDALNEAGFAPNSMQGAVPDDVLLGHLVTIVRTLGHFPTAPELRLWCNDHPDTPSHNTFLRLGNRGERLRRLAMFAATDPSLHDLSAILGPVSSEDVPRSQREKSGAEGYVYLLKAGGYCKIGRTNHLGRRDYELSLQLPEKARMLHSIRTDDPEGIERYWHQRFAEKRANGEWFRLSSADIQAFRRREFM